MSFVEPDRKVVSLLEQTLRHARTGKVRGVIVLASANEADVARGYAGVSYDDMPLLCLLLRSLAREMEDAYLAQRDGGRLDGDPKIVRGDDSDGP